MSKTTKIRRQTFTAPKAAENDDVHAAITLPASGVTVVTTAITNPDVARAIRLKVNQDTTEGLEVIIAGTDILDQAITETVTMGEAFATTTDSLKAFKTVTSITVPTRGGASDTISVGLGAALGLDCYCDAFSFVSLSGTSARTVDSDEFCKNTATRSATLNGTDNQALNYVPTTFPAYGRIYG